nr:putative F-box/kelch-repeat protein At1g15680 isoform X1 [Ipomoea trifida]
MADCEAGSSDKMADRQSKLRWDAANHESNNLLCDELVGEILVRLPTTAAVRFKAVCKRWYSLISSPYFIARFRDHHTDSDTDDVHSSLVFRNCPHYNGAACNQCHCHIQIISNTFFNTCSSRKVYGERIIHLIYLPCYPHNSNYYQLEGSFADSIFPHNSNSNSNYRLEGSFADLILCSCINTFANKVDYYVSNPLTRQWIALPPLANEAGIVSIGFLCVEDTDTSHHNKFMVVRLCLGNLEDVSTPRSQFKVQIFSSENWQWRTLVVSSPLALMRYRWRAPLVAYRGMLHWLNGDCIVVYDPLNTPETFSRVIHLPIQTHYFKIYKYNCFGVSQGRLRVAEVSDEHSIYPILDVWELEDYDSGSWILVHKVHLRDLIHNGLLESFQSELSCFSVLSLHPQNGDVFYLRFLSLDIHDFGSGRAGLLLGIVYMHTVYGKVDSRH